MRWKLEECQMIETPMIEIQELMKNLLIRFLNMLNLRVAFTASLLLIFVVFGILPWNYVYSLWKLIVEYVAEPTFVYCSVLQYSDRRNSEV